MAVEKTLFILIVVLSIASTLGKPAEENSNDVLSNEEESSVEPKFQLFVYTFQTFKDISLKYVNQAQNISKHILKDEAILERSSNAEIQAFQKNLTHFMEKYNNYRGEPDVLFDLVDVFANATEWYMKLSKEDITPDTAVVIETLKKFGSDKLELKFEQLFNDFVEQFKHQFEEAKIEEKAMLEWFDQLKTLTNVDDKVAAFNKFYEFY